MAGGYAPANFDNPEMTFLRLENVDKSYGGAIALSGARLEIAAGEVHALMGENGAGKSTIIKILAGVTNADSIDMFLEDVPANVANTQDAFDHGFRFIHQELNIVRQLSVAENIILGRRYPSRFGIAVDWAKLNQRADAALNRLQVTHIDTRQKMARLSTGDQMLVKIASLLVAGDGRAPRLYVMDEPTAALTGEESEKLFQVIGELKSAGASVLYVSHRMNEVMDICDKVTVFRDGRTVATKSLTDTGRDEIIRQMTGRNVRDVYPPRTSPILDEDHVSCDGLATKHIRGVKFGLRAGEILGVAGLANAGQSALLHALLGLDKAKSGKISIKGVGGKLHGPASAWRSNVAYIPGERRREGLMLRRSIIDNIALPHLRKFRGMSGILSRRRERRHGEALGKDVALKAESLRQPAYQLSGGNQQKVLLARAIGDAPKLLLLDEPTRGVDVGAKFDIYSLVRKLSAGGTAVVVTSSDLPELVGMCDRILIMREGSQHAIVPTKDLSTAALLAMFYD